MPFISAFAAKCAIPAVDVMVAITLHDRVQVRVAGESPAAESFHRDSPGMRNPHNREYCFGGFQNCDHKPQYFCGVIGSHLTPQSESDGFAKMGKAGQKKFAAMVKAQAGMEGTDKRGRIIVPPGYFLLFLNTVRVETGDDRGLIHAVNPTPVHYTSVKMFWGMRITDADNSGMVDPVTKERLSYEGIEQLCHTNGMVPLGSGQANALWPAMSYAFPKTMLVKAKRFVDDMLVPGALLVPFENSGRKDWTRSFASLADMGLPVFKYRPDELALLHPQKVLELFNTDTMQLESFPLINHAHKRPRKED